jgi:alpha-L-arabinofuranosidase
VFSKLKYAILVTIISSEILIHIVMKKILFCLLTLFTLASLTGSSKETILITVQADKTGAEIRPAMYASSSLDRKNGKLYVKIVNLNEKPVPVRLDLGRLQYTKTQCIRPLSRKEAGT